MTVRRYYHDSYTRSFRARVLETPAGDAPAAVLDETFFYPTSGGQPHDTGRLGNAGVVEVVVREADGAVLHLLDAPLAAGAVEGTIDWPRRFDHMQQHSGQHILSQAFLRVAQAPTLGFHLGAERVSLDLGSASLSDAVIADAEACANAIVHGNSAVRAWFPTETELRALALRKPPEVEGALRVVAVGDFDLSACGGTHVAATGEIGLIAVLRSERLKRGTRIEFLCGERARADYLKKHAILRELSAALTCAPDELAGAVTRQQAALQEARRELALLLERALDAEADRLLQPAADRSGLRVLRAAWADRPVEQVRGLALRLTEQPGVVALLGIAGARAQVLFARSEDAALELRPAFDQTLAALGGGRGGGARLLQGAAGPADLATLEQALAAAESTLFPGGAA